jgi:DNA-directed RNA polymerase specialized sigma24 family protein
MQEQLPLNELFKKYTAGLLTKKEFEGRIFQHILDNYHLFRLQTWTREDCGDFLSWLYPRLSRAIDLYRDLGASFDAYIGSMVRWTAREYRSRQADHRATEYACWLAKAEDMMVHSPEPEYPSAKPAPAFTNRRQILILLLKSYHFVSDDFLARVAAAIKMELEEVRRMVEELRDRRHKREEEIEGLRQRIHCQYYRCICFERRLGALREGSVLHGKMAERLVRAKTRLGGMKRRLGHLRFDATNRQIAEVLNIPKGTVDSNLYALKAKWRDGGGEEDYPG